MEEKEIIKVALDIGNHDIKLLVGRMNSTFDKISIIDYVKVRSKGVRKSEIENPEVLLEDLEKAIKKLIDKTGIEFNSLSLSLGGSGIVSATENARLSFQEKEIDEETVDELYKLAKKKILHNRENDYRVLCKEIYNIRVNNAGIVKQPIGMLGKDLQADVHIVYIEEAYAEKFIEIINRLGLDVDNIYLSSYVSAKGTLGDESRKMGVAHVDIGYGVTDIILLKNYKVLYAKSLALGEMHYISDMIHMFSMPYEDAAIVLKKFKRKEFETNNTIKYGAKTVALRDMYDMIQARTADIIKFITSTIEESGFNGYLAKGIVLTGGVVEIPGVLEQIGAKSGYVVRKELPVEIKGLNNPFYSDSVVTGIFLEDMEKEYRNYIERKKDINYDTEKTKIDEKDEDLDKILEESKESEDGFFKRIGKFLSNLI